MKGLRKGESIPWTGKMINRKEPGPIENRIVWCRLGCKTEQCPREQPSYITQEAWGGAGGAERREELPSLRCWQHRAPSVSYPS